MKSQNDSQFISSKLKGMLRDLDLVISSNNELYKLNKEKELVADNLQDQRDISLQVNLGLNEVDLTFIRNRIMMLLKEQKLKDNEEPLRPSNEGQN